MARIIVTLFTRKASRKELRGALRRSLKDVPKVRRGEVRRKIREELKKEEMRRLFRAAKVRGDKRRREIVARYDRRVLKEVRDYFKWRGEVLHDVEYAELAKARSVYEKEASRTSLKIITRRRRSIEEESKYRVVKWQGGRGTGRERRPKFFRAVKAVDGEERLTGKRIPAVTLSRRAAALAYWDRVRGLAEALGVSVSEARRIDRLLVDIPESLRRKIYDRVLKSVSGEGLDDAEE